MTSITKFGTLLFLKHGKISEQKKCVRKVFNPTIREIKLNIEIGRNVLRMLFQNNRTAKPLKCSRFKHSAQRRKFHDTRWLLITSGATISIQKSFLPFWHTSRRWKGWMTSEHEWPKLFRDDITSLTYSVPDKIQLCILHPHSHPVAKCSTHLQRLFTVQMKLFECSKFSMDQVVWALLLCHSTSPRLLVVLLNEKALAESIQTTSVVQVSQNVWYCTWKLPRSVLQKSSCLSCVSAFIRVDFQTVKSLRRAAMTNITNFSWRALRSEAGTKEWIILLLDLVNVPTPIGTGTSDLFGPQNFKSYLLCPQNRL